MQATGQVRRAPPRRPARHAPAAPGTPRPKRPRPGAGSPVNVQQQKTATAAARRRAAVPPRPVYVNPFARSGPVTGGRIDQGVDYTGQPGRPIGALGPGQITYATQGSGWPGGGFIIEKLTAGPAKGRYVYTAEDVQPTVQPGQQVKAGQQIGKFNQGGWIETGWGAGANIDETLANLTGQSGGSIPTGSGWFSTGLGKAFDALVRRTGGPAGKVAPTVSGGAPPWASAPGGTYVPAPVSGVQRNAAQPPAVTAPPMAPVSYAQPSRPPLPRARPGATTRPRRAATRAFSTAPAGISPVPSPGSGSGTGAATATSAGGFTGLLSGSTGTPSSTGAAAPAAGRWDWLIVLAVVAGLGLWARKEWRK